MSLLIIIDRKKTYRYFTEYISEQGVIEAITCLQKPCYDNIGKSLGIQEKQNRLPVPFKTELNESS